MLDAGRTGPFEWAVAGDPVSAGASGDGYLVRDTDGGAVLAVVDGLGHGEPAAHARAVAVDTLTATRNRSLPEMVERCHRELSGTRGVAAAVAVATAGGRMTWLSVGDVEALVVAPAERGGEHRRVVRRGGVVGYRLPRVRPASLTLSRGDAVVMATDGVSGSFVAPLAPDLASDRVPLPELARGALDGHGKTSDDALVLLSRFEEAGT